MGLHTHQIKIHDQANMPIKSTPSISSSLYGGPWEPLHETFVKEVELRVQNNYQTMGKSDNVDNKSKCSYSMVNSIQVLIGYHSH